MEQPSYYSILTADVRYSQKIGSSEKLLFSEITALSNRYGYCTASNSYFANLYGRTKKTISGWISNLVEAGYLKSILVKEGKQVKCRKLYPITNSKPINENVNTPINKNGDTYKQKNQEGINRNVKENNTSINKERDKYINNKEQENQINEVVLVDNLLNYYAQQCAQWHEPFPEITVAEKASLIQVVKGKTWNELCSAVDKTLMGAESYPVGYLIRCIKNE